MDFLTLNHSEAALGVNSKMLPLIVIWVFAELLHIHILFGKLDLKCNDSYSFKRANLCYCHNEVIPEND